MTALLEFKQKNRAYIVGITLLGSLLWLFCGGLVACGPAAHLWPLAGMSLLVLAISLKWPTLALTGRPALLQQEIAGVMLGALLWLAAVLYGLGEAAFLAGLAGALVRRKQELTRWDRPFYGAVFTWSLFNAGLFFQFISLKLDAGPLPGPTGRIGPVVIALLGASVVHYLISTSLASLAQILADPFALVKTWRRVYGSRLRLHLASVLLASLLYALLSHASWSGLVSGLAVLLLTYFFWAQYRREVAAKIESIEQVNHLHLATVEALATAIDAKDQITHDHVRRVQIYAVGLARLFGLSQHEIEALKAGALLHDVGKIAVPDYILNKPGKLTAAEFEQMKVHTIVGAEILSRVGFPYPIVPIVRHHHERWDGQGYPDRLKGESIPVTARILSVTDCFDALREDRQYRKAMTREEAMAVLLNGRGTLYDPTVVDTFIAHLPAFEAEIAAQKLVLQEPVPVVTDSATPVEPPACVLPEAGATSEVAESGGPEVREAVELVLNQLQKLLPTTTCAIFLREQNREVATVIGAAGRQAEQLLGRSLKAGVGIAGWVTVNNRAMFNSDPALDLASLGFAIPTDYRTAAVVPLSKEGRSLGALALYSTDLAQYTTEQQRLLEGLAPLAAEVINRALKEVEINAQALTDSLTGLPNLQAFMQFYEQERNRAQRYSYHFTLLTMNLTGFKVVNERYGLATGDKLLVEVARVLKGHLRGYDFLARYGNDEFVAILPETEAGVLDNLIVRLQDAIDGIIYRRFSQLAEPPSISFGYAEFGLDGTSFNELLTAADRMMFLNRAQAPAGAGQVINFRHYRRA